ncbi:unnamed protein product [Peniophora sp. CBMAI 1063]|nr:unnamed protein product [Peniophora sp. CBMAI 1063]
MSPRLEEREATLIGFGLARVTEGEHTDAWKDLWGEEVRLQEQPVWKEWSDALKPHKRNASITDLALATGVLESSHDELSSCRFLDTPWRDALTATYGRILVTADYQRLQSSIVDLSQTAGRDDVVVGGQSGSGRTYLAYYLLALALARQQNVVFFAGSRVVVFSSLGVFDAPTFNVPLPSLAYFERAVGGECIALVDVTQDSDICPSEKNVLHHMHMSIRKFNSIRRLGAGLSFNISRFRCLLSSLHYFSARATLQLRIKPAKQCLLQLLKCLAIAGPNLRACLSLDAHALRASLERSILSVSPHTLLDLAETASFAPAYLIDVARATSIIGLFSYRKVPEKGWEGILPAIASRPVIGYVSEMHGLSGLSALRSMQAAQDPPDGFVQTREWLFEHICHSILMDGTSKNVSVAAQCPRQTQPRVRRTRAEGGLV